MCNVKRALEEKQMLGNGTVYPSDLVPIIKALAEPVECEHCQCHKEFKPGMCIEVDDVKTMICAKCHKPIKMWKPDPIKAIFNKYKDNEEFNKYLSVTSSFGCLMWKAISEYCES